ncbi:MAG: nucleotidyltransferase domain-containing protein [Actinomycetes bacterium]
MRTRPRTACPFFASSLQASLMEALFERPSLWQTSADLRDRCGVVASSLHRELMRLVESGIVERDATARPHRFRIDMSSPLAGPVGELVALSLDAESLIKAALDTLSGVEAAGIFGSWARGEAHRDSDIDLMIIGDCGLEPAADAIRPVELKLLRDVNLVVLTRGDLDELRDSAFIRNVAGAPLVNLVGSLRASLGDD